jgi:SAM-dependent methyltransferase
MKVAAVPETLLERVLCLAGVVPTPLIDTFQAIVRARAIMVASRVGIFDALKDAPKSAASIAKHLSIDPAATDKLLGTLAGSGYLDVTDGLYRLSPVSRRWLLEENATSLHDNMLHRFLEWNALNHAEEFVRTGRPLDIHERLSDEEFAIYQKGMRSLAGLSAGEVGSRLRLAPTATAMLDIGGSHGFYSATLCRRYPQLRATILELPRAVRFAKPLLDKEGLGDRVAYRAESVLTADLGVDQWDLVFISQLMHHFSEATNAELMQRIAKSLRPGGTVAVLEVIRPEAPGNAGQTGSVLNFFFALTSLSGCWSLGEISGWQERAGLRPRRPIRLRSIPGAAIQTAFRAQQ